MAQTKTLLSSTRTKSTCGSKTTTTATPRVYALQENGEQLLPNGNTVNWNRGILCQLGKVGTHYEEWIDHPKIGRIRMFDSDFLEGCSFTYWWVVPCLYIPWGLLEVRDSYRYFTDLDFIIRNNNSVYAWNPLTEYLCIPAILSSIIYFLFGLIIWSLFEYYAHRVLFHWHPSNPKYNLIHFLGHGLHHLTPADDLRLVFPPAISMTLGLTIRYLYLYVLFGNGIGNALVGGFGVGYAFYESTHYLSHHCGDNLFGYINHYLHARFRYHSAHHFNPSKKNALYGVTSQIWDVVFNTF